LELPAVSLGVVVLAVVGAIGLDAVLDAAANGRLILEHSSAGLGVIVVTVKKKKSDSFCVLPACLLP
jgi:hypothetical protein